MAHVTDPPAPIRLAGNYPIGATITEQQLLTDPYPVYRSLQEREPVTWVEELGMWWVVGHGQVTEILLDDARFATSSPASVIRGTFGMQMLSAEGEQHARYKRAARPAFQPQAVRAGFTDAISRLVDELIDDFAGSPGVDLRAAFAAQLPVRTILHVFGLPQTAAPQLRIWFDVFEKALANFSGDEQIKAAAAGSVAQLHAFLMDGIAKVRGKANAGFLAELVNQPEERRLTDEEVCRNASIIMFGGISTVEALILNSVWTLAMHPQTEARVRQDQGLLPRVIEEVLRWQSPVQSATRYARADVDFHGHRFRAGETVNCMLAAANRDPAFLADAERFDIDRNPLPRHLAFATGSHFCIGLHLARLQARIALERLYARLEGLTVDAPQQYCPRGYEFRQPDRLPVVWRPRR